MIPLWVVYDHPTDHPDVFVARRFETDVPTDDTLMSAHLETIRLALLGKGLACIPRAPADDPVIVEIWL